MMADKIQETKNRNPIFIVEIDKFTKKTVCFDEKSKYYPLLR